MMAVPWSDDMAQDERDRRGDEGGEDLAGLPSFSREPAGMLTAEERSISQRAKEHADELKDWMSRA